MVYEGEERSGVAGAMIRSSIVWLRGVNIDLF